MRRASVLRRLAQMSIALLLSCSGVKTLLGQELGNDGGSGQDGTKEISEIFQSLSRTPVSALDLGLLKLQQLVTASLLANKPQIFSRGRLHYVDVTYSADVHRILISGAYRSRAISSEDVIAECKDDIDIILSAISLDVPAISLLGSGEERSDLSCSTVNSMFANQSTPNVLPNVCHSVGIWIRVESDDGKAGAECRRRFDDSETEIITPR